MCVVRVQRCTSISIDVHFQWGLFFEPKKPDYFVEVVVFVVDVIVAAAGGSVVIVTYMNLYV